MNILGDNESLPEFRCSEVRIKSEKEESIMKEYKHGILKDLKENPITN